MPDDSLVTTLKTLKCYGMASAIAELAEQQSPAYHDALPMLESLLKAEVAERDVRSINYQMKVARFPSYRDLAGFSFNESTVDETLVNALHQGEFIESSHNAVFIGGPGTGKTHLATAIGVQAIQHLRLRVRCFSTIELVNMLELEKANGKHGNTPMRQGSCHLIISEDNHALLLAGT